MKSSNTTDKWEDTTELLDYGFNEFKKLTFSLEELRNTNYPVIDRNGMDTYADISSTSDFNCLVLKSLTKEDVEISYVADYSKDSNELNVKASFSLKTAASTLMYSELGELEMLVDVRNYSENDISTNNGSSFEDEKQDELQKQNKKHPGLSVFLRILAVIGVVLILLQIRRIITIHKIKKRRHRRGYNKYKYYYKK